MEIISQQCSPYYCYCYTQQIKNIESMSSYKQQVQYLVQPKFFKCLRFSYKSDYNIGFKLIYETQKGKKVAAVPFIIKSPLLTSKKFRDEKKEPKGDQEMYQTQQFNVMFEDEDFDLNEMCIFKLEYNGKKMGKGKTYLELSLLSHKNLLQRSEIRKTQMKIERVCREIQKIRVDLNRSHEEIDQFYNLTFNENDYFGFVTFFISSAHLGWKLRRNNIHLSQFLSLPTDERLKLMDNQQEQAKTSRNAGLLLKSTVKEYLSQINQFHLLTLIKQVEEHERLISMYEKYRKYVEKEERTESKVRKLDFDEDFGSRNLPSTYETDDINQIYFFIYKESQEIANYNRRIWQEFYFMMLSAGNKSFEKISSQYLEKAKNEWFRQTTFRGLLNEEKKQKQKKNYLMKRKNFIRSLQLCEESEKNHPLIFFEELEEREQIVNSQNKKTQSLIIFVHGYQGSSSDLEKASNYLLLYNRQCEVFLVKALENSPEIGINRAAQLISEEIKLHIKSSPYNFKKISIVGYSLGGVIARAAIQYLQEFKDKFHILITFSSPHLGLESSENQLVRAGIWYMTKFSKAPMISDMKGKKDNSCEKSYMKILSEKKNISWFKKIVLVSCREDEFVPYCSSTISQSTKDGQTKQLSQNICKYARKIQKVEVWFDIDDQSGTFDKLTGRKSHIEFLDNDKFLNRFFQVYGRQF